MKTGNPYKERGSVTIEATISLTAFMFAIITILTFLNICLVQAKVSYAINSTAKELSQYSYLYSLTGLNEVHGDISAQGKKNTEDIPKMISNVNTIFNEVESLTGGGGGNYSTGDTEQILERSKDVFDKIKNIESAGEDISQSLEDIGGDPKKLMFGIAQMTFDKGLDLAKSRMIAAPLSRALCKKHLVSQKDGSVDAFLKKMGVVPAANGSYYGGLDFGKSTIFPEGSNEITVNVSYTVKVIALLPVDWKFHFNQTAVTHGWLAGEASYAKDDEFVENHNIWTDNDIESRVRYIRSREITIQQGNGYEKTKGLTDVQLYNPSANEFIMISSMNPLYSDVGDDPKTLDDLSDEGIQTALERLCQKMNSTTDGLESVTTRTKKDDGSSVKNTYNSSGAKNKIVLVIPEDEGLQEHIQSVIDQSNTHGVTIELQTGYGNGARTTEVNPPEEVAE